MRAVVAQAKRAIVRTDVPVPRITQPGQILIRVSCSALNRADTLQRRGAYPPPPGETDVLGLECAGVVEDRHPSAVKFGLGEKVMALLPGGGFARYVVVDEGSVMSAPVGWSDEAAASVPEVWLTAFQLVHVLGGLPKTEFEFKNSKESRILIHAAASGVGLAAIQLARHPWSNCPTVVGTTSKGKVAAVLQAGATAAVDRNGEGPNAWVTGARQGLGPKGASLILDPVGKSYVEQNLEIAGSDAHWILFGLMGGADVGIGGAASLLPTILRKRIKIQGTTLRARSLEYKRDLVSSFVESGKLDLLGLGTFKTHIDKVFRGGLEDVDAALDYLETNATTGKVIVRVHPEEWA